MMALKKQIKFISGLLIFCSLAGFAYSQNTKGTASANIKSDSAELKALVVKLLKWHNTDKQSDFDPLQKNPSDTAYTGIDWAAHNKRIAALEKTNFFTKSFLDSYQKIALHLDKELKENKTKYLVGDLPPYDHPNEWCNCQDYPGNIWKRLKITGVKINHDFATFKWTWGSDFFYTINARKEKNVWKIAEMESFNIKNFSW